MNYEFNRKYINGMPIVQGKENDFWIIGGTVIISLSFTVALMVFLGRFDIPIAILIIAAIVGAAMLIFGLMTKEQAVFMKDEEYDSTVKKGLVNIREKAINALGIDETEVEEIEPISFDGYLYKGADKIKRGNDGRYRSNKYHSVYIMFSANEAHVYKYTFDTTQNKHNEETDVYFYKDIVSVSTSTETIEVFNFKIETTFFKLTTAGGNSLSISIFDDSNAQRSINAMRALLREKKQT